MRILFLCGLYPERHKGEFLKNSKRGYQFAAQNLQEAIIQGFKENGIVPTVITLPFLSTFPLGYKKPTVCYGKIDDYCKCVDFVNIPFLRETFNTCKTDVFNWCRQFDEDQPKHILVYSLTLLLMKAALAAKDKFKNVNISIVIPDLPQYMACNRIYKLLGLKDKEDKYILENIINFDSFILLSETMATSLLIENRRYCVVEGIFNKKAICDESKNKYFGENTKVVLYTGALVAKYGIETLINAFLSLSNTDYRLVICGDGEAKEIVAKATEDDDRIIFLGKVEYQKVIALQKEASLLVNPRTPEGEYTKYSFPSKTMEYFASATPVLMYRLPGVPDEYFEYCYAPADNSQQTLAKQIDAILSLPLDQRKEFGARAADFIETKKSAKIQVKKIISLINI